MPRLALLISLLSFPAIALAHSGAPFGTHPFIDDGVLIGGGTDYGMLIIEDDGVPYWTCEEAFEYEPNWWFKAPGGPALAGTFLGMRVSTDGGCTWLPPTDEALAAPNMAAVGFDPEESHHVFVATGEAQTTNRIYESTNGGVSFQETGFAIFGVKPRGIAVAAGAERLWVLAIRESDAVGLVYGSEDGGVTWSDPVELVGWAVPEYLGLSEDAGHVYISAFTTAGEFYLLRVATDLLSPAQTVAQFESPVNAVADYQGLLHVSVGWISYFLQEEPGGGFELQETGPTRCFHVQDGVLWGCGLDPFFPQFASSTDGVEWTPEITFDQVVPRECPAGSRAADLCPDIWTLILELAGGDDDDSAAASRRRTTPTPRTTTTPPPPRRTTTTRPPGGATVIARWAVRR